MIRIKVFMFLLAVTFCVSWFFAETGVQANPAPPVVSGMSVTTPVDLSACSSAVVWCNATVSDEADWKNIDVVNATLWDYYLSSDGYADDNNNHYTNSSCTLDENVSLTEVPVRCSFDVQYYANPGTWTCAIHANNTAGESGSSAANATVNTLRALDAENSMDFGSLSPGSVSPGDVNNGVTNCGNVPIDLNLSGTDLTNATASVTNVSVSYVKYNVTDAAQSYADAMIALSTTPAYANFTLAKRTTVLSVDDTYWKIGIPASIENLVFTGTISFTAVPDT